jgi:hypothetical protein
VRGAWVVNTCQAPVRSRGGILRCVLTRKGCTYPGHRRYDRVRLLAAVVWWLRPWWPNRLGRAQDRGDAHVCPNVYRCRACGDRPRPAR